MQCNGIGNQNKVYWTNQNKCKVSSSSSSFAKEVVSNSKQQMAMPFNLVPNELLLEDIPSSQEMNDDELDAMVERSKPGNTKKSTRWGWTKLKKWMHKRNLSDVDMGSVSEIRLNEILRKFYAEVKSEKKGALTPSALTGIRAAIHRSLIAAPYNRSVNIITDTRFTTANQMFQARCRLYQKGNNAKPQHKPAIEKSDKILINQYFHDALQNPTKLQEFVWFTLCYHFGRRGREGWRNLKRDFYVIEVDGDGKRYVCTKSTETSKNIQGGQKQTEQDYSDCRMYAVSAKLDPVAAFELLLLKSNPDNPFLFQKPAKNFVFESQVWFTKELLGKNTLGDMMKKISQKAGLKKTYTNHCVRATTVTDLYQAGVDTQQICAITKHRNEGTLKHYISGQSLEQKQHASTVLSSALLGETSTPSGGEIGPSQARVQSTNVQLVNEQVEIQHRPAGNLENIFRN